jgi:hypothetical protein
MNVYEHTIFNAKVCHCSYCVMRYKRPRIWQAWRNSTAARSAKYFFNLPRNNCRSKRIRPYFRATDVALILKFGGFNDKLSELCLAVTKALTEMKVLTEVKLSLRVAQELNLHGFAFRNIAALYNENLSSALSQTTLPKCASRQQVSGFRYATQNECLR